MDQRLLSALENLGNALEEIASALQSKEEAKTSSVQALKAGDFGKQLESINTQLKSIKADTQEILREQKTIQSMSKQKDVKKETPMEEIGKDKKKESALKKGIGTILLIAVAVLAIGMAFKLVGKIDFLSVIGLGLAMYVISESFAKIAKLDLSLAEAFRTSLTMVMVALAVTVSSWILKMIIPLGFLQITTGILIATMFYVLAPKLERIAYGVSAMKLLRVGKLALITTLVGVSAAITASSWVLQAIVPVGPIQMLTAILIAGMFFVISTNLERIAYGVSVMKAFRVSKFALVGTLVGIAAAITASSWVLQAIIPIGLAKALTAILISAMFLVISLNFEKIAAGVAAFDKFKISKVVLLATLVGIALAITMSSWVLSAVVPIGLMQFLTALGIAILFAVMSYVFPELAAGVFIMEKAIGKKGLAFIPLMFVALALAIMLSSHILAMTAKMDLQQILNITLFGIGLGLVVLAMLPSVLLVGIAAMSGMGAGAIALGVLMIPLIAAAVAISSHIIAAGKYTKYPSLGWVVAVGLAMTLFGAAVVGLGFIALTGMGLGTAAILIGTLMVPLIAMTIVNVDKIIAKGRYNKYPGLGWVASVGSTMTLFGAAVVGLGILAMTGLGLGALAIIIGTKMVPKIANTIVEVDKIISKGKYNKYPSWRWIASVGATMTGFGAAVVALGILSIQGLGLGALAIIIGTKMVPKIANTIVEVDRIISRGKYNKYPSWRWIASVGATMTGFGAAVVALGILSIQGFGLGALAIIVGTKMVPKIAEVIVAVDKIIARGNYKKYPGAEWALSVGSLMTIFGAAVVGVGMIIVSSLGLGYLAIKVGASAVKTIAQSIVDVAWIFNKNSAAFKKGPTKDWAEGVGIAISAFAPVYKMMMKGGIMTLFTGVGPSPKQFARAIKTISQGIVDAAWFFSGAKVAFQGGPKKEWSEGVGKAIGAFAPVYKILAAEKGLFGTGVSINKFKKAIIVITNGIIESAKIFAKNTAPFKEGNYPSVKWGQGVGAALKAFTPVFKALSEDTGWFTSGDDVINNMVHGIIRISGAIVGVAKKFKSVSDWKSFPTKNWSWNVKLAIGSFVRLINKLGTEEIYYGNVINSASKMVKFAKILHSGRKYFSLNIDPNYMKKVGKNILDFNFIVQKLAEAERGKGVLESVGGAVSGMFGKDPISRIAARMVMLAGAYDKLATALIKLGGAMKVLNISDARMLGGITRAIVEGRSVKQEVGQSTSRPVANVRSEIARVRDISRGGGGKEKGDDKEKKLFKKMDDILKVLRNIDRNVSSVDDYIADQSEGKYPTSGGKLF